MSKKKSNTKEIIYNIVNSLLAGALILLGAFTTSADVNLKSFFFAIVAAAIVAVTQFKEYWAGEKSEYSSMFAIVR